MNIEKVAIPTHSELVEEFRFINRSRFEGIKGVWCVSSALKGPSVGITIHTHGNEPSGLVALWYMRHKFHLWDRLRCGRVFFVLNNILATHCYLKAGTKVEKLNARFVDTNMNRLPANLLELVEDRRYEIKRARELLPVWREFTVALDIHSTAKKSPPMIIQVKSDKGIERLIRDFPIKTVIAGIAEHQLRRPAVAFYGNPHNQIPAVGIEAGPHENKRAFAVAIEYAKQFLAASGVVEGVYLRKRARKRRIYFVGGSVVFPDRSWRLTKVYRMFERVRKGQVLAVSAGGQAIKSPFTGVVLFGPPHTQPVKIEDEVLFLAKTRKS